MRCRMNPKESAINLKEEILMDIKKTVKVRFAPSPTGYLHIGGLRTALFNWLFARHHEGLFYVRIEDTDLTRSEKKYSETIIDALAWAGIDWDNDITYQSDRVHEHKRVLETLLQEGKAYKCYCTTEQLMRRLQIKEAEGDVHLAYDGYCRSAKEQPGQPYVIRFKLPLDRKEIVFDDCIRGKVVFEIDQLDDFVIARSDGTPVYNFVVVVDDHHLGITQVIRGEDHISNTPKQILLYEACKYAVPQFAHIPLILNVEGRRLSKRDQAASVWDFKELGYLSDALINYLVRLGWSHGDQELFTKDEMIHYFTLEKVGKSAAIFNLDKLAWFNGVYIRNSSDKDLLETILQLRPRFRLELTHWNDYQVLSLVALYKQRVSTIIELADDLKALHDRSIPFDVDDITKWIKPETSNHLKTVVKKIVDLEPFSFDFITECVKELGEEFGCKLVELAQPIRIALLGRSSGPGVFELLAILGKNESVDRLKKFILYLDENESHR
jgi:glutamyl-tRNA synthetase